MGAMEDTSQGMGDAVDDTHQRVREGDTSEGCRGHHPGARLVVSRAVFHGPGKILVHQANGLQRKGIGGG